MPYKDPKKQREAQAASKRRRRESVRISKKAKRRELAIYVSAQKERPCLDCGRMWPSYVMDFDHVRGSKVSNISKMANQCRPLQEIDAEIAKCDLVCANCHRIRTHRS